MSKRPIMWLSALAAVAGLGVFLHGWLQPPTRHAGVTQAAIAERLRQLGGGGAMPIAAPVVPLDPKRPIRLAIGSLGQGEAELNSHLADLVLSRLTGAPGLELVERPALDQVLHELGLSLSGLVRAGDAVRVGKLLRP